MFDSNYKPAYPRAKEDYNLRCPIDTTWANARTKVLVVIETIDPQDLKHSQLLADRSGTVIRNLLTYSIQQAKAQGLKRKDVAFATLNFNNHKFMDQPKQRWPSFRTDFAKRVRATIEDLEPTVVLVFGDYAAKALLPDIEYLEKKRGWVIPAKFGKVKCKVVPSLDLLQLYTVSKDDRQAIEESDEAEDAGDVDIYSKSNLMFYVSGHVVNALLGRMLYDLSNVTVKPVLIKTLEGFEKLYARLKACKYVAIDTETKNLSVNHNAIQTMQFAFPECLEDMKGYMLPLHHEETPFSKKEILYMEKRLRKFFYAPKGKYPCKYLIMQNGKFDCRVIRKQFRIPLMFHDVWELTAGEWCFHPDTLVETATGRKRIQDIVNSKDVEMVWSFNHAKGQKELKPILLKHVGANTEQMLEIAYESGSVRVTESHKIWSNDRKAYVEAKDIKPGEDLELF